MNSVTQHPGGTDPPAPPAEDFPYGWRYVERTRPDGRTEVIEVPLTLEDALHPELGDVMPESTYHSLTRAYLMSVFIACTYDREPTALVVSDTLIYWDIAGLRQHSPDVGLIFGVRNRDADRTSFNVAREGARPRLLVEIVSKNTRENDVATKVEHYQRARVPCYVILDRPTERDPWRVVGYQYTPDGYVSMPTDERGRLWLADVGVWLGIEDNQIVCYDGRTDAVIGDYHAITQQLATAEQSAEAEAARADAEAARAEAEAARADAEAQARQTAEARLRELEAELARLRGQPPA